MKPPAFRLFQGLSLAMAFFLVPSLPTHGAEPPFNRLRYRVLTAQSGTPPPFVAVDFVRGPTERLGRKQWRWWQMELRGEAAPTAPPLVILRALTSLDPLADGEEAPQFARYQLRIPDLDETLEYRDAHLGSALLPGWKDFVRWFVPLPAAAAGREGGQPQTCELLGHVLTLTEVRTNEVWQPWTNTQVLDLDRELLVGTGRGFKDQEGHRLPQQPERRNYTYVPFVEDDYITMVEAGMNLFTVGPEQEKWVRAKPVFYVRGSKGTLRYPADLYRANFLGPVMFMDEPSITMIGDKLVHDTLRYFSDAAALIEKRTRVAYWSGTGASAFALDKALRRQGANLGDMTLVQTDIPSWETLYETAFYQMKGGGNGIIHEGRYQLGGFDQAMARLTGLQRPHTPRELLEYHYAFLRGGVRPFGKFWGTAIYGQCDPNLAPQAVTLAYDRGARYVWFWTSDHEHHVPWPEQLALSRVLKEHAQAHPRLSIYRPPPKLDTLILIPNGCILSLESLWWVRGMDKEGTNEAARKYRRLAQRALQAVEQCFAHGETFDISVDDGRVFKGYRRVLRITDH